MIPKHDRSGPALPTTTDRYDVGMSLRDYLATNIVLDLGELTVSYAEGITGKSMPDYASNPIGNAIFWADFRSKLRYIEADSMLRAREAEPE